MGQKRASGRVVGPQVEPQFALHHRQPRADKLDAQQRRLCHADPAFLEALRGRVASPARFSAFLDGAAFYVAMERSCGRCGGYKKRTRDRSCYGCHISRSAANFERIKAGLAPKVSRSLDGHLDVLERQRAERAGEHQSREFAGIVAKRWPTGRLEVTFPDGHHEHDLSKLPFHELENAVAEFPRLKDALRWAGWM